MATEAELAAMRAANAADPAYQAATAANAAAFAAGIHDTRAADLARAGIRVPSQQTNSSQFWMDTGYNGPEPSLNVKALYSDAQYAYDTAQATIAAARNNVVYVPPAAPQQVVQYQPAPVPQGSGLDLSGINTALQQGVNWIQANLLIVVLVLAAVIFLPAILGRSVRG